MRAILLGPNGQLGSDIVSENTRRGEPIGLTPIGRDRLELSNIERAAEALKEADFDVLINCSSYHKTDEAEKNANLAFDMNAHLVCRLAQLCREKKARFVHVSTDYVFGGQAEREPLAENTGKAPLNVYGASKGMGEDLASLTGADVPDFARCIAFRRGRSERKGWQFRRDDDPCRPGTRGIACCIRPNHVARSDRRHCRCAAHFAA